MPPPTTLCQQRWQRRSRPLANAVTACRTTLSSSALVRRLVDCSTASCAGISFRPSTRSWRNRHRSRSLWPYWIEAPRRRHLRQPLPIEANRQTGSEHRTAVMTCAKGIKSASQQHTYRRRSCRPNRRPGWAIASSRCPSETASVVRRTSMRVWWPLHPNMTLMPGQILFQVPRWCMRPNSLPA